MELLSGFGWTPERDAAFAASRADGLIPGRVIATLVGGHVAYEATRG